MGLGNCENIFFYTSLNNKEDLNIQPVFVYFYVNGINSKKKKLIMIETHGFRSEDSISKALLYER
ncbi:hypothetical protein SAMN05421743_108156 [Thalassobacillus cyri]|uniref:Uncharacterized protein n=1 Tax=Thalassobacillus cyri TaxID=571932 RepID=A0A1H4E748_9BACI|nr:hypothetical protein SAMN05421743_108156 [Thalassobacillus cyri]